MASPAPTNGHTEEPISAAEKLLLAHTEAPHHVTVEDEVDEDLNKPVGGSAAEGDYSWAPNMSTKAAGKQKETTRVALDTKNEDLFPALGAPKSKGNAQAAPQWNVLASKTNGSTPSGVSAPASGNATPTSSAKRGVPTVSLPGRSAASEVIFLEPSHIMPRHQLKRPLPDIIKEINRRSRANISIAAQSDRRTRFEATGPQDAAQQALKELVQQIGTTQKVNVPIPQSARAHIIGKQGSTIKALQEQTGARIQLPKVEENSANADEDDDDDIIVVVEGNAISAAAARDKILKIANERAANVSTKVKGIPAEFYPFIAGHVDKMQASNGAQIQVPPHQVWSSQAAIVPPPSGQRPNFQPAVDHHIQVTGGRAAVQGVKADIERLAAELRENLRLEQVEIDRGRHQFVIGQAGHSPEDFFEKTGCTIILPTDEDEDAIIIIGPADQIREASDLADELAMRVQMASVDHTKWTNKQAPGQGAAHSKYVTQYLRQRKEIERLEKQYNARINTPFSQDGALPWQLYIPQGTKSSTATTDIRGLFEGHPPSRMRTVPADPFFHNYIRSEVNPHVRENYGVQLVVPEASDADAPILLVYEAPGPSSSPYEMPRTAPSQTEVRAFEQGLREAEKHILDLLSQQDPITAVSIDVPLKFHDKLKKFIKKEQENRPASQIPVRVSALGTTVTLRGPTSSVQSLADKVNAWVEQEKSDEKERGYTLEFDFPQKFANHLIGKQGSNIKELREKYDVEIHVSKDGKVELQGPKAKAEIAKSHILSLGKQLADEATEWLKIDPKFHRELIGSKGNQINRLQERYKVLIFFPRTEKNATEKNAGDDEHKADAPSTAGKPRQAPDEVMIRGPKRGVEQAKEELWNLYQFLKDTGFTATVSFQQKQLPTLIGQGGSGMESLRQLTGAKIDIPNGRESADSIVEIQIKGTKAQVAAAKKLLEEKKSVFDDTVIKTIEVDKKYHRTLIGTGGKNIREMIITAGGSDDPRERARTIQFPKAEADGNTIKLEGRTDVVEKMIKQIQDIVSQQASQVSTTIDVPVEKHRSLIGRGGDTKKQMEKDFSVSIDIPRQGSAETGVKITGQEAAVKKAEEHILNLTKDKPSATIQVPRSMHNSISNNGQFFRKLRNDFKVTVDHAGQTPPSRAAVNPRANGGSMPLITDDAEAQADAHSWNIVESTSSSEEGDIPWVLKGSEENIEKAKKAIEDALKQGQSSNVTGLLVLPDPHTYRHVIGQGGSKVNSIRKQSGCKINVPRGQEAEAIEIIGSKEGVEKAKDLILAAVRDGVNGSRPPREE